VTDENGGENGEDPALKSLSHVFKSLFNNSSSSSGDGGTATGTKAGTSGLASNPFGGGEISPDLLALFQNITPMLLTPEQTANILSNNSNEPGAATASASATINLFPNGSNAPTSSTTDSIFSPLKVLKLLEPLINEKVVKEINTVYEFHIRKNDQSVEVYHLDLKNVPRGKIGHGPSLFSKADCVIKLSDEDLKELLTDNLKPFTAYMSGRIEIEGVLQDVFKLKKLIKSVTSVLIAKKPI
jgi:putative sterol carrier protein